MTAHSLPPQRRPAHRDRRHQRFRYEALSQDPRLEGGFVPDGLFEVLDGVHLLPWVDTIPLSQQASSKMGWMDAYDALTEKK